MDRDPELASIGNGHDVFPCGNLGEVVIVVFHQPPHQGLGRIEGENLTVLPQENRLGLHICAQRVDGTAVDGDLNGVDAGDAPHGIVVRIDLFSLLLTFLLFRLLLFLVDLLRLFDSLFGVLDLVFIHLFDRHQVIELVNHRIPVDENHSANCGPLGHAGWPGKVFQPAFGISQNRM